MVRKLSELDSFFYVFQSSPRFQLSYSLITALLGHTSAQLLKLIVDYTQFQEDKLKDSTFNDSVGDGEHSLEDLYHQYDIIDDIHTFEVCCFSL